MKSLKTLIANINYSICYAMFNNGIKVIHMKLVKKVNLILIDIIWTVVTQRRGWRTSF